MATPKSPRNNQDEADLTELVGCENWSDVEEWFGGMTVEEIKAECDRCWPLEANNAELTQRIFNEV